MLFTSIISAKPASFQQDFKVTWADSHLKFVEGGNAIQLKLDQSSGNVNLGLEIYCQSNQFD